MKNYGLPIFLIFLIFCLSSCATGPSMTLNENTKEINTSNEGLALMVVKIRNQYKPDVSLTAEYVWIATKENGKKLKRFKLNSPYKTNENGEREYLVSFQLPPGKYTLETLTGHSKGPSVSGSDFWIIMRLDFDIKSDEIKYLGHIEIVGREKKNENEETISNAFVCIVGSLIQCAIDKSLGLFMTTFDVYVRDNYEDDITIFKDEFSVLQNREIVKMILPEWIRPENR